MKYVYKMVNAFKNRLVDTFKNGQFTAEYKSLVLPRNETTLNAPFALLTLLFFCFQLLYCLISNLILYAVKQN